MKVICCGGRDYDNRDNVAYWLNLIHSFSPITCIIHGNCRGVDKICGAWAMNKNIAYVAQDAEWEKHGKAAGVIRNAEMLKYKPNLVVAFPGGSGTKDMAKRAYRVGIPVFFIPPNHP